MIYITIEEEAIVGFMEQEGDALPEGNWTLLNNVPEGFKDNLHCYRYINQKLVYEEPVATVAPREFYNLSREQAYPDIGDQLDSLFHAGAFPPEMMSQIQAVKDAFPKPTDA